jgi:putative endonuclease
MRRLLSSFSSARDTRARGRAGERAAGRWLRRQGFEVVSTNFRAKPGEIDIIAREGDTLCFIEIKARANDRFGGALAAVPVTKQQRISRAASAYLMSCDWDGPCRFDVLGLEQRGKAWEFQLIRDAFWVGERS